MLHQAVFNLGGADSVAAGNDNVVVAAVEPEISFLVPMSGVAGQQPAVAEFLFGRIRLVPVAKKEHGVRRLHGNGAGFAGPDGTAFFVNDLEAVAGNSLAHRAFLELHDRCAVANGEIGFGLTIKLVHCQAEHIPSPVQHLFAQPFAAARDRAH
jgi:hypothetical protein